MTGDLLQLNMADLGLAYGLVLLSAALVRWQGYGGSGGLLRASLRMVVQLLAVGYLLEGVFALRHPLAVAAILAVMGLFALQVIGSRVQDKMPYFYRVMAGALLVGCGLVTWFFCVGVVGVEPWYEPRYLIPLAGMIVGNSMNGAALAAERLAVQIRRGGAEIEAALCLGASPRQAVAPLLGSSFRAAMIPATNTMAAMGIVALPGMMTGQILSGTAPIIAVRYQIAIMCAITGAVALTTLLILHIGYRSYFTADQRLKS
ncbi:iron export ABC transporter permease subunit FetB [Geothermobacter hydrogeniphilus]|uniref:Iron export ABC transporter permease subunit FetB n=1 Tax=Geothermobacter hydrogeniphilus TaxID=1969733 RepID=A0A2K2H8J2_9BACT|nr:iron export ABC transporter permease subunit FetB [Geothermobacter hydrogeniphilus]PNU19634.1 iron export ABC transporter permease subunit FetB [Geothermobacter hydrogeniphilus]